MLLKINSKYLFILLFLPLFFGSMSAVQAALPSIDNPFDTLQVKIPGMARFSDAKITDTGNGFIISMSWIGEYIIGIYNYAIGIIGILAVLAIAIGGVIWIMAFGNPSKVAEGKAWITGAILGLVLALSSYILLNTIDADLVRMRPINLGTVATKIVDINSVLIATGGSESLIGIGNVDRECIDESTLIDLNEDNCGCDSFSAQDKRITPRLAGELKKVCNTAHQLAKNPNNNCLGMKVDINSAYRTMEHQARLYEAFGRNSARVAPPSCNAPHVAGVAIDAWAEPRSCQKLLQKAFQMNGWLRYCSEAWHFQPAYDPPGIACSP